MLLMSVRTSGTLLPEKEDKKGKTMQKTDVPFFIQKIAVRGASFQGLAEIALAQLQAFKGKAEIVCGPISTGGYGSALVNLFVFNHAIEVLQGHGRPMWSQVPFEAGLADLEHQWSLENPHETYCMPIMTEFYWKLIKPKLVRRAWFIGGSRGWETSTGAKMEWERMGSLGIDRRVFPEVWHRSCALPAGLD